MTRQLYCRVLRKLVIKRFLICEKKESYCLDVFRQTGTAWLLFFFVFFPLPFHPNLLDRLLLSLLLVDSLVWEVACVFVTSCCCIDRLWWKRCSPLKKNEKEIPLRHSRFFGLKKKQNEIFQPVIRSAIDDREFIIIIASIDRFDSTFLSRFEY